MPETLDSTDKDGKVIEVGSVINYYRSDGWYGGYRHDGLVLEIKPKTYVVQPLMEQAVTIDGERVTLVTKDWRDEKHRVAKETENRWGGVVKPALVRSAEEQRAFQVMQDEIRDRAAAQRARLDEENAARREAEQAAAQKRQAVNDAINVAVERLKAAHPGEFEMFVGLEYLDRDITPADLDEADAYYNRAYAVRPPGFEVVSVDASV